MRTIKVLIVDDSPVFRALLTEIISSDPMLEVVGQAEDPYAAREMIKRYNPDVLTLDIEMPKMNGVQFLKNIMRLRPMPVIMISTLTQHGAGATLAALEYGAVDYFPKPKVENAAEMIDYRSLVNEKIKMAAEANVGSFTQLSAAQSVASDDNLPSLTIPKRSHIELIAIGASTGGTEAVKQVLAALPAGMPPIVITQHISALFSPSFAKRLNDTSRINVQQLDANRAPLIQGGAYLAPGDKHLVVSRRGPHLYAQLDDRPAVNRHKPSVDVMFDSIAETVGSKSIGVILTGMGQDGAQGLLKMKQQSAVTIAQDEKSSIVWGMPRVAIDVGAAKYIASLNDVAALICKNLSKSADQ